MSQSVGFRSVVVTVATAGTPVSIKSALDSGAPDKPYRFEMHVPNANTGSVFIGDANVDDTHIGRLKASAADNPNGTYIFIASENASLSRGEFFDFSKIFIDADNNGDAVIIQYLVSES